LILLDSGPLVALFDPRDRDFAACRATARRLTGELVTTPPVLTEVSHLLGPASAGFLEVGALISAGDIGVDYLDPDVMDRMFRLMEQYRDQEMDFADASLVAIAEARGTRRVWSLDRRHFSVYRVRHGQRFVPFELES
jgi:predicted nucleic acid-binding protein